MRCRLPLLDTRLLVERDHSAPFEQQLVSNDHRGTGKPPFRQRHVEIFLQQLLPADGSRGGVEAEELSLFPKRVDAVSIDGRCRCRAPFVQVVVEFARIAVRPEDIARLRVQAPDNLFAVDMPQREQPPVGDRDGTEADADLARPRDGQSVLGPIGLPARFARNPVPLWSHPVGPRGRFGGGQRRARQTEPRDTGNPRAAKHHLDPLRTHFTNHGAVERGGVSDRAIVIATSGRLHRTLPNSSLSARAARGQAPDKCCSAPWRDRAFLASPSVQKFIF